MERRLPVPNATITSDSVSSPTSGTVSGRLASLSLGGPNRSNQDFTNASIMLPPVGRASEYNGQNYVYQTAVTEDLYACTAATNSNAYAMALPPMLTPSSQGGSRYGSSSSAPSATSSITGVVTPDRPLSRHSQASQPSDNQAQASYGWATANDGRRHPSIGHAHHDDGDGSLGVRYQPIAPLTPSQSLQIHQGLTSNQGQGRSYQRQ